jgi:hypothetical protein
VLDKHTVRIALSAGRPIRACWRTRVIGLALALGCATRTLQAQHKLVALSLDDPVYEMFDALDASGCAPARVSPYRPWLIRDVRAAIRRAVSDSSCTGTGAVLDVLRSRFASDTFDIFSDNEGELSAGGQLTVRAIQLGDGEFRPLWRGVRDKAEGDPPLAAVARARVTWGANNIVALAEIVGFTDRQNDPAVRQRALRNTSGALDFGESYVTGQIGDHFTLSFGRMSEAWLGHGRESLVLSAYGPPLDRVLVSGRWRRLEGRALYASIGDVGLSPALDSIPASTSAHFYRYLVAHALTIRPGRGLEITLGESALLARGARTIDLAYANPFMFYVVTQNDTSRVGNDQNDNLQAFGALHLRSGGSQLFAELLIDDIQIDPKDRKTIQDQLGWSLRGLQSLPFGTSSSASAEYRHINSFTYQRGSYATVYQSFDAPLGSELGSDADMIHGGFESWATGVFRMTAGAGLWRQGAQRLDQRPGRSVNGSGGQPYPSITAARPLVQRALLGDAAVRYLRYPLVLGASVEVARVMNPRNQPASALSLARMQVMGSYAYRIP